MIAIPFSVTTQQDHYVSRQVTEWRALCAQQWVREKILCGSTVISSQNIQFNEKSQQNLVKNLYKMREERNALFIEKIALKEKEAKATEQRVIHPDVKHACFKLIIDLGSKVNDEMKL